jgi:hypothetical protein
MIVNGGTGHVLDAQCHYEKWGYVGRFGRSMAVGDVDQDCRAEIVFLTNSASDAITIIEGDTFAVSTISASQSADRIAIADANADGVPEIILTSGYSNSIGGIRRSNSQILYTIANSDYGLNTMSVGDVGQRRVRRSCVGHEQHAFHGQRCDAGGEVEEHDYLVSVGKLTVLVVVVLPLNFRVPLCLRCIVWVKRSRSTRSNRRWPPPKKRW